MIQLAQFGMGSLVRSKANGQRAIVRDVDPALPPWMGEACSDERRYLIVMETPGAAWEHPVEQYVYERDLLADESGLPVTHPALIGVAMEFAQAVRH